MVNVKKVIENKSQKKEHVQRKGELSINGSELPEK